VALGELGRVLPICQMFVVLHDLPVTSPSVSDPVSELVRGGRRSEDIVEYAWWFGTKPKAHMAFDNVVFANRDGRDVEYRSMPVAVPHRFVRMLTDRGDLVLDPFAGSNSTGVAAEGRGRRWVSVEAESLACARAARRLK
jgi:DNA modification methylase